MKVMDTESRLHGRLFSKRKCDAITVGAFTGSKNLMRPAWLPSDPKHAHCGLQNLPPPRALPSLGSCVRRRIILLISLIQLLLIIVNPSSAALINVENCLSRDIINHNATLQFIPMFANAVFNATTSGHNLNVTVYGNIVGGLNNSQNFSLNDTHWSDNNQTDGKIPELGTARLETALRVTVTVLDYPLFTLVKPFCNSLVNKPCPLAPVTIG